MIAAILPNACWIVRAIIKPVHLLIKARGKSVVIICMPNVVWRAVLPNINIL